MATNNAVNNSSNGEELIYLSARLNTTVSNVTGDENVYILTFPVAFSNPSSAYNAGTGLWTCPVAGIYQFQMNLSITMTDLNVQYCQGLIRLNRGGVTAYYGSIITNTVAVVQGQPNTLTGISTPFSMAVNDTCSFRIIAGNIGGSLSVSIKADTNFGGQDWKGSSVEIIRLGS